MLLKKDQNIMAFIFKLIQSSQKCGRQLIKASFETSNVSYQGAVNENIHLICINYNYRWILLTFFVNYDAHKHK